MTRITVDEALRRALRNFAEPLELCDESGHVVARLVPTEDLSKYVPWEPVFSKEELDQCAQSDKWFTTQEVLDHLKSLEKQ